MATLLQITGRLLFEPLAQAPSSGSSIWLALAEDAARQFGTPSYVVRWLAVEAEAESLERRFSDVTARFRLWLSFKTHPVRPLADAWLRSGRGVEVVSEHEFVAVHRTAAASHNLLVNGVAKHTWLGRYECDGLRVHFDSIAEVRELLPQALAQRWRVGLRCHVPMELDAAGSIFGGQFGLSESEVCDAADLCRRSGLGIEGLHFHLGHGASRPGAYTNSVRYLDALCARASLSPRYIDCGGGALPGDEQSLADFEDAVRWADTHLGLEEIWAEHGRYITHASTALVLRVLDTKDRAEGRYLICDGGRSNQALAADRAANPILTIPARDEPCVLTTITGPTCMMDDRLGRVMLPATVQAGDLVVWLNAGAYHLPWESRFSQGLCAVVWCDEADRMRLSRTRETPEQWDYLWTAAK